MRQIKRDQAILIDKCYVEATISFLLQVNYQEFLAHQFDVCGMKQFTNGLDFLKRKVVANYLISFLSIKFLSYTHVCIKDKRQGVGILPSNFVFGKLMSLSP